ncbi:MAG TPA: hypothetical protein VF607_15610, partial [Verrucomicrobiae bacterium]
QVRGHDANVGGLSIGWQLEENSEQSEKNGSCIAKNGNGLVQHRQKYPDGNGIKLKQITIL